MGVKETVRETNRRKLNGISNCVPSRPVGGTVSQVCTSKRWEYERDEMENAGMPRRHVRWERARERHRGKKEEVIQKLRLLIRCEE